MSLQPNLRLRGGTDGVRSGRRRRARECHRRGDGVPRRHGASHAAGLSRSRGCVRVGDRVLDRHPVLRRASAAIRSSSPQATRPRSSPASASSAAASSPTRIRTRFIATRPPTIGTRRTWTRPTTTRESASALRAASRSLHEAAHERREHERTTQPPVAIAAARRGAPGVTARASAERESDAARLACRRTVRSRSRDDVRGSDRRADPLRRGPIGHRQRRSAPRQRPRGAASHAHGDHIGDRKMSAQNAGTCAAPDTVLGGAQFHDRGNRRGKERRER